MEQGGGVRPLFISVQKTTSEQLAVSSLCAAKILRTTPAPRPAPTVEEGRDQCASRSAPGDTELIPPSARTRTLRTVHGCVLSQECMSRSGRGPSAQAYRGSPIRIIQFTEVQIRRGIETRRSRRLDYDDVSRGCLFEHDI